MHWKRRRMTKVMTSFVGMTTAAAEVAAAIAETQYITVDSIAAKQLELIYSLINATEGENSTPLDSPKRQS